jgi:hypothetical protein
MAQVIPIGCITRLDLPVDTVLDAAREQLDSVVLCGYTKDGEEYFASTIADGGDVLWLLERCKTLLLKVVHDE